MHWQPPIALVAAYILGSIPSAYIASKLALGIDVRELGDGNMGARNVLAALGVFPAVLVSIADLAKGGAAVLVAARLGSSEELTALAAAFVVLGHIFPFTLRFRGGQGMATMVGAFVAMFPLEGIIALAIFAVCYAVVRHWDKACYVGFGSFLLELPLMGVSPKWLAYSVAIMCLIFARALLGRVRPTKTL